MAAVFEQVPENFASMHGELIYAVKCDRVCTFDAEVIDADSDDVLGVKRFVETDRGRFDAAPFLRRHLFFLPRIGPTGFQTPAGRTVPVRIAVDGAVSPVRLFVPGPEPAVPSLVSPLRGLRRIGRTECDELTFRTEGVCEAKLTIQTEKHFYERVYTAPTPGYAVFRLNAADFPDARSIVVSAKGLPPVNYRIEQTAGCRIAWRSAEGSIERYTFPAVREERRVRREGVRTDDGYRIVRIRAARVIALRSAYEPERVRRMLEGITASQAVWHVEAGVYVPVEVLAEESGFRERGTLRSMELVIRHEEYEEV